MSASTRALTSATHKLENAAKKYVGNTDPAKHDKLRALMVREAYTRKAIEEKISNDKLIENGYSLMGVVRCGNCKHGTLEQYSAGEYCVVCNHPCMRKNKENRTEVHGLNWFCPFGEPNTNTK